MTIDKNTVVSIDYTLTNDAGQVLDSSKGRSPLVYLHGNNNIIPGLEAALQGKNQGDVIKVTVEPEQAYGVRSEQMVQAVPREKFQGIQDVRPGMQFQAQGPQGSRIVTVTEIGPDTVTIDANHPLAGTRLTFDVNVVEIRSATPEELQHGHPHGPGGHQH